MFKFDHKKETYWDAIGFSDEDILPMTKKMNDFANLYHETPEFRASFDKTPRSFQCKFIIEEILEIDTKDFSQVFVAGHLIGAFQITQKMRKDEELSQDKGLKELTDELGSLLDRLKQTDSDDF